MVVNFAPRNSNSSEKIYPDLSTSLLLTMFLVCGVCYAVLYVTVVLWLWCGSSIKFYLLFFGVGVIVLFRILFCFITHLNVVVWQVVIGG